MKRLLHHRVVRFAGVGVLNTLIDFVLLNTMIAITHTHSEQTIRLTLFNAISVSIVACISFFLNRKVVFRHSADETPAHHIFVFIGITLAGLFLVNEPLFALTLHFDHALATLALSIFKAIHITFFTENFFRTNIAKALATCGSLIWNYLLYKRFVFKTDQNE